MTYFAVITVSLIFKFCVLFRRTLSSSKVLGAVL